MGDLGFGALQTKVQAVLWDYNTHVVEAVGGVKKSLEAVGEEVRRLEGVMPTFVGTVELVLHQHSVLESREQVMRSTLRMVRDLHVGMKESLVSMRKAVAQVPQSSLEMLGFINAAVQEKESKWRLAAAKEVDHLWRQNNELVQMNTALKTDLAAAQDQVKRLKKELILSTEEKSEMQKTMIERDKNARGAVTTPSKNMADIDIILALESALCSSVQDLQRKVDMLLYEKSDIEARKTLFEEEMKRTKEQFDQYKKLTVSQLYGALEKVKELQQENVAMKQVFRKIRKAVSKEIEKSSQQLQSLLEAQAEREEKQQNNEVSSLAVVVKESPCSADDDVMFL